MRTLPTQNYGATAAEFQRSNGSAYVSMFRAAKEAALEVDGTPEDPDSRKDFVTLANSSVAGQAGGTYVTLWGEENKQSASVRILNGSYIEEEPSSERGHGLATQKDRFIEITEDRSRNIIMVEDRLSQSLTNLNSDESLLNDHQNRVLVVTLGHGTIVADNARDARLLFETDWSIPEFQRRLGTC